ncbi:MAG: winged helix-turn-helix domain-containing protein [Thermoprotei archaeon]
MSDAQKLLEVLGEESRYKIIKLLLTSVEGLTVADIANRLNKDKRTIDKHLKLLLDTGLVERTLKISDTYVYRATQKAAMLIELAEELARTQPTASSMNKSFKEQSLPIIKKQSRMISIVMPIIPSLIFLLIGILIGYGSIFGLVPQGYEGVKLLGMLFFILLSVITYIIMRRWTA